MPGDQTDPNARGPAHKKFSNYVFDVEETLRIVKEAGEKVLVAKKKIYQKKTINDEL